MNLEQTTLTNLSHKIILTTEHLKRLTFNIYIKYPNEKFQNAKPTTLCTTKTTSVLSQRNDNEKK